MILIGGDGCVTMMMMIAGGVGGVVMPHDLNDIVVPSVLALVYYYWLYLHLIVKKEVEEWSGNAFDSWTEEEEEGGVVESRKRVVVVVAMPMQKRDGFPPDAADYAGNGVDHLI